MNETRVLSLGQEDPLAKGMATYSSILAWEIPWTGEPGKDAVSTWHCKDWTLLSNCNRLHESPLLHLPLSLGFSGTSSQFIKLQLLLQKDFKGEKAGNIPGNPVVKTPCPQCRLQEFNPWSGNYNSPKLLKIPHDTLKKNKRG